MKPVHFLLPAEQEMLEAARYYEMQASGLGIDFLAKIDSAIQDISEQPELWPVLRFRIRRRLVHQFPYGLLYRIDSGEIVILAVMHLRRHPNSWISRI